MIVQELAALTELLDWHEELSGCESRMPELRRIRVTALGDTGNSKGAGAPGPETLGPVGR